MDSSIPPILRLATGHGLCIACAVLLYLVGVPAAVAQAEASNDPRWQFDGNLRVRWETLEDSFRLAAPDRDELMLTRLDLALQYDAQRGFGRVEVQDSRAWGDKMLSPLGTDDVNTLEPVAAHLGLRWASDGMLNGAWILRAGRMTIDYGSRRLLARNRFRNTSNAFQGVRVSFEREASQSEVFYTYPLQRQPTLLDGDKLRENEFTLDKAGRSERFWGFSHDWQLPDGGVDMAVYFFASELSDRPGRPVADRRLRTLGARLLDSSPRWEWEFEGAYQWGRSRKSAVDTASPLDHEAWFVHAHAGLTLRDGLSLQLVWDGASGDRNPQDSKNQRFDRLYGARAFELGPSGIFGAGIRSNLRSPAVRLRWRPGTEHQFLVSLRQLSLDSARDQAPSALRVDASGLSGRDLGRQWELRWRWQPAAQSWATEIGAAYLDKGAYFSSTNPDATLNPAAPSNSRYLFAQVNWRF